MVGKKFLSVALVLVVVGQVGVVAQAPQADPGESPRVSSSLTHDDLKSAVKEGFSKDLYKDSSTGVGNSSERFGSQKYAVAKSPAPFIYGLALLAFAFWCGTAYERSKNRSRSSSDS